MELLLGEFGPFDWPVSLPPGQLYMACVHIPYADFERLGEGPFEKIDRFPPYLSYVHENFQLREWNIGSSPSMYSVHGSWLRVYFTTYENALLFYMCWAG